MTITAYGVQGNAAWDLYQKNASVGETGLGLNGETNNEINPPSAQNAILLDLTNLVPIATSGTITLESLQSGEGAKVCTTASLADGYALSPLTGCSGQVLESGSTAIGSTTISWSSSDPYLVFTTDNNSSAPNGNFLVSSLTANTSATPEPSSLILFGTALLGLAVVARKFRNVKFK